jgi:hypothetical protein
MPTIRHSSASVVVTALALVASATSARADCIDAAFPVDCQAFCCPAGTFCGAGTCINPRPCSDPAFPLECNGATCCAAGSTCNTVNPQLCCPPGYTVSCQHSCCPASHHCASDGETCLLHDQTYDVLSGVQGLVRVNMADAHAGQKLNPGDVVEVDTGAVAVITLYDPPGTATLRGIHEPTSLVMPIPESTGRKLFRLLRGALGIGKDPRIHTKDEVEALNDTVSVEGTVLSITADSATQEDTVDVTVGTVTVTPKNAALPPFTLHAGERVVVGATAVGAVTSVCPAAQCDDGDPCTLDGCTETVCEYQQDGGLDAVCSTCRGGLGSPACTGQPLPASVGKRLALACSLRDQAASKPAKAAQKLLRRAAKNVKGAATAAKKAGSKQSVSAGCAGTIAAVLR